MRSLSLMSMFERDDSDTRRIEESRREDLRREVRESLEEDLRDVAHSLTDGMIMMLWL